jgi:SH3-like domain-containing protein
MQKTILVLTVFFCLGVASRLEAACVSVKKAVLRAGPGLEFAKKQEVPQLMPLKKLGVSLSGDWYAVQDLDGEVRWIEKNLLTEDCRSVAVKFDNVPVRTGPDKRYPKSSLGSVRKYSSFLYLEEKFDWVKVRNMDGAEGWIHKQFLWIQ